MIVDYRTFILESDNTSKVAELLTSLKRNYDSSYTFRTDETHFKINSEDRKWESTYLNAELEKTTTLEAKYILDFELDGSTYKLSCIFSFSFHGQQEKDAPTNDDAARLAVVLDGFKIKKLTIESDKVSYDSDSVHGAIKKSIEEFLVKSMSLDYDQTSSKIYSIEQQK